MKISKLDLRTITIIQLAIATLISLLFQFIIPLAWQPLDRFMYGPDIKHGDEGMNVILFTTTQWFFSFSIAWLIYRDNPFINNYVIYSLIPLGSIMIFEFSVLFFYDYIHIIPVVISAYILWKKRDTLDQKYVPPLLVFFTVWLWGARYLGIAYVDGTFGFFLINYMVAIVPNICLSFAFRKNNKNSLINPGST